MSVLRTALLSFKNLQICLAKCDSTIVPSELVIFIQDCDHTRLWFRLFICLKNEFLSRTEQPIYF